MRKSFTFLVLAAAFATHSCKRPADILPANAQPAGMAKATMAITSDYGEYKISCVTGGKFLEVTGNPGANEKYLDQQKIVQFGATADDERDAWQRWYIIYRTTVNGVKYYHIRNSFSGKILDVPSATTTSGTQLQQYAEFPVLADQQLWRITEIGTTGQYNIINKGNGLALANANGSTSNGTAIIQETPNTDNRQRWVLTQRTPSTYRDDQVVRFFNRNNPAQGSVAFDQGNSIPLTWSSNAGKVLWVTQDATDGSRLLSNSMFACGDIIDYGNSMLVQPSTTNWASDAPNVTRNGSRRICDIQPGDSFAWPGPGVEIGNHVYVQVGEGQGLSIARQSLWDITEGTGNAWTGVRTTPANMSNQTAINYSTGMIKGIDGYVYAYGFQDTGFGFSSNIYLARFPSSNPQSWTFWNGSAWVNTPVTGNTSRVTDALGTSNIAFVNNKYVLMTMDQGFDCSDQRNIYIATSSNITGPFTARTKVYTIQENLNGGYARYYTPVVHPEHANGRNELLLTYCLNFSACNKGDCSGSYKDPYFYRVKGIRVPYAKIGL
ncbi:RICIN domain-containing protein [Mucilaginibacter sp. CSA2-8R]|uniref:RICIN domain-containing protein n=1 Tax=Mucilaginibacter sp. CSA2-8R TaxID=3141542 RepID=UPI00315DB675